MTGSISSPQWPCGIVQEREIWGVNSMKARKVKTILGLGVAACAVIVTWLRPWEAREPVYGGKPLSHWVVALENYDRDEGGFHPPPNAKTVVALRAIGPAAV